MDSIVRLDESYAEELAALNRQLIEDEGHSNSMSESQLANRMRGWLRGEYLCFGIVDDARIVAYSLHKDAGDFYYIRQLFTARDARNQGLASKLLAHLETHVLTGKPIRLEVLVGNTHAQKFYAARGYLAYCHTLVKYV